MVVTTELPHLSLQQSEQVAKRRRVRNYALLVVLLGVALLFYLISVVRMHP